MPLPIWLAHRLAHRLAEVRKSWTVPYLGPDGKTQVSVRYEAGRPVGLKTVVISTQHTKDADLDKLPDDLRQHVIGPELPAWLDTDGYELFANPSGRFELGGPRTDTGLTGRKIIVDTYGGWARHGGGAFSGKDPSKVDRSGSYAARWVAKHVVASGAASRCEIQVAYAIGVAKPVSVLIEAFGTERVPLHQIEALVDEYFDLSPVGIISALQLRRPIYRQIAAFGHFGRSDLDLPWEQTEVAAELAAEAGVEPLVGAGQAG
jgi:S-adenosylmethionine synthetase